MPNHVRNSLTVYGPARDVATFVMRSQTLRPRTGDVPLLPNGHKNMNYQEETLLSRVPFDFYGVVPLPEAYSMEPYADAGYEMEIATWGVKWGPYRINPTEDIRIEEHQATYHFTTASGPPDKYFLNAAAAFPHCIFAVSWGGEGPCFGRALLCNGEILQWTNGDSDCLPDCGEGQEQYDTYDAAVLMYLTDHNAWVKTVVQRREY